MNDLYKTFRCKNKEELYIKVKEKKPDVQELLDYIDYAKITNNYSKLVELTSDSKTSLYINNFGIPHKDEVKVLLLDAKLHPVHFATMSVDAGITEKRKALYDGLRSGAFGSIFVYDESVDPYFIKNIKDTFQSVKIRDIDSFIYMTDGYISERGDNHFSPLLASKDGAIDQEKTTGSTDYYKYLNSDEFFRYYAENELKGLNLNVDREKINSLLRVGFKHPNQEFVEAVFYDNGNNITGIERISAGGRDSSLIDLKILGEKLLEKNPKGMLVFHNHPSGDYAPSKADIEITEQIKQMMKFLQYEFEDHLIVSERGVFSVDKMREEKLDCSFSKDREEMEF